MEAMDLILLAAGQSSRVTGRVPKQFLDLAGTPVVVRAVAPFERLPFVRRKIVAAAPDRIAMVESLLADHGITNVCVVLGGETRQESVRRALEHVATARVLTHNAAVPFATPELIGRVAACDAPCATTVTAPAHRLCRGTTFARETIPMDDLKLINTPQSFDTRLFRECHRRAFAEAIAVGSDCELMLRFGHPVRLIEGTQYLFKITTDLDWLLARAVAERQGGD